VQHGTFSISNYGVSDSLIAAPIVIPRPYRRACVSCHISCRTARIA